MRSDAYYHNVERAHEVQSIEREKLEQQVNDYLASGGKIAKIPAGASNYEPISVVKKNKGQANFEPNKM